MPQIYMAPRNIFTDSGRMVEVSPEEYDLMLAEHGDLSGRAADGTATTEEARRLMELCVMLGRDTEPARRAIDAARAAEMRAASEERRLHLEAAKRIERCVAAIERISSAVAELEELGASTEILPPERQHGAPDVRPDTDLVTARSTYHNEWRSHGMQRDRYAAAADAARRKIPADLMRRAADLMEELARREGAAVEAARAGLDAVGAEEARRSQAVAEEAAADPATIADLMRRLSELEARQA